MTTWDFACPDWWDRLQAGRRPWADLPLDMDRANHALRIFENFRLPDVADQPRLEHTTGQWFKDAIAAVFGGVCQDSGHRMVTEVFALVPKKNSKTTYTAALGLTALMVNKVKNAAMQILGPTKEIAQTCFDQACAMIEADPMDDETGRHYLQDRFHIIPNKLTIKCRVTKAILKVKTFDMKVVTGSIPILTIIDELHLLSSVAYASRVITQLRGVLAAKPDAVLMFITTQSDEVPAGAFKQELEYAREVRDGIVTEGVGTLPILYEFPEDIQTDENKPWLNPAMWKHVTPNLGYSIKLDALEKLYQRAVAKGKEEEVRWLSQHLNIQVGMGLFQDRWIGVKHWAKNSNTDLTLEEILDTSDVVVGGVDGGGLDDMLGTTLLGRHAKTRDWQAWSRAWIHPEAIEARKESAERYEDFRKQGDLIVCEYGTQDLEGVASLFAEVNERELFPETGAIGLDPAGVAALIDELVGAGIGEQMMVSIGQGYRLSPAVWGAERKLKDGTLIHCGQEMLNWCVSNARTVQRGNAVSVEKAISGKAKIDPVIALFNAVILMSRNPTAHVSARSPWDDPNFSLSKRAA